MILEMVMLFVLYFGFDLGIELFKLILLSCTLALSSRSAYVLLILALASSVMLYSVFLASLRAATFRLLFLWAPFSSFLEAFTLCRVLDAH